MKKWFDQAKKAEGNCSETRHAMDGDVKREPDGVQ